MLMYLPPSPITWTEPQEKRSVVSGAIGRPTRAVFISDSCPERCRWLREFDGRIAVGSWNPRLMAALRGRSGVRCCGYSCASYAQLLLGSALRWRAGSSGSAAARRPDARRVGGILLGTAKKILQALHDANQDLVPCRVGEKRVEGGVLRDASSATLDARLLGSQDCSHLLDLLGRGPPRTQSRESRFPDAADLEQLGGALCVLIGPQ